MLSRLTFEYTRLTSLLAEKLQGNFYLYLAALLSVGVLVDAGVFHVGANMKQKAFDFVVKHRVITPKPDPDIVIVDVNEASLAALAPDYGRWPWPRQVFGEFVEKLEAQKPKAIVFDILFSDADLQNPDSDAYFNDAISAADNIFFPFLRLPEQHDNLSQVKPGMIPGSLAIDGKGDPKATVAVVLPHFEGALKAGRLGTHNIEPDADGVSREYRLWHDKDGWRLPSLPLLVGNYVRPNAAQPQQNMLLNWRGGPFTYHNVSFSDVYQDMTAKTPKRPANEFTGKIVIIGSTAPSLFDLKATPMAKVHPGVEILATAIDNLKHDDDLKFWRGQTPYILLSLLAIWLTAWAFYRDVERERLDKLFPRSQLLLLVISYIGLNLSDFYIDLTAPVTWAVACFGIAKIYALANDRASAHQLNRVSSNGAGTSAAMAVILMDTRTPLGESVMLKLRRALETEPGGTRTVEILKGSHTGMWALFGETLLISWRDNDADKAPEDILHLIARLPGLLKQAGVPSTITIRHALQQTVLDNEKPAAPQWRSLFAQAVLKLEQ
jgi:CHASE2 domain-containing sensor protein